MNHKADKNATLIAIVIIMAMFLILTGWSDGRFAGTGYAERFQTEVALAETITVDEYELVDPSLTVEELSEIPKVDVPAGSTSKVFEPFEFYSFRNPDKITITKPTSHTIRTYFKISDDKSVRVVFTDDKEQLQLPGNYVDINKLESYSDVIASYDEALDDWLEHWHRSQIIGALIGVAIAALISIGFYFIKKSLKKLRNSTLFGISITIIILCFLNLLLVWAYLFPHLR